MTIATFIASFHFRNISVSSDGRVLIFNAIWHIPTLTVKYYWLLYESSKNTIQNFYFITIQYHTEKKLCKQLKDEYDRYITKVLTCCIKNMKTLANSTNSAVQIFYICRFFWIFVIWYYVNHWFTASMYYSIASAINYPNLWTKWNW